MIIRDYPKLVHEEIYLLIEKLKVMRTMKMIIGIMTLVLIGTYTSTAQLEVGVRTGAAFNNSKISGTVGEILPDSKINLGYSLGIYADIAMNNSFSFHPEIAYTSRGFTMDQGTNFQMLGLDIPIGVSAETQMKYLESLALLRYKIGSDRLKFFVEAGPGIGYATSAVIQPKATLFLEFNLPQVDVDLNGDTYNRTDVTANIGTGVEYDTGQGVLGANLRYSHGLANVLNDPLINTRITHQSFNLGISYGYRF